MSKKSSNGRLWADGERTCVVCETGLPAHEGWLGAPLPLCESKKCAKLVKTIETGYYIKAKTRRCGLLSCENYVAAGRYKVTGTPCCSLACGVRLAQYGKKVHTCACCGVKFNGIERKSDGRDVYLNPEHRTRHLQAKRQAKIGPFRHQYEEFLKYWETSGRARGKDVAWELSTFLSFVNECGITDLDEVRSTTISRYLQTGSDEPGRKSIGYTLPTVSSFFKWMIAEDLREYANPVVPGHHKRKRGKKNPNPLNDEETEQFKAEIEKNGTPMLRLAAAIALEGGMRAGEVMNIRLDDFREKQQRIQVRLPTKGKKERFAWFSDDTLRFYREWMKVRPKNCDHDFLLTNRKGGQLLYSTLRREYLKALTPGGTIGSQGNYKQSAKQHRLRHTFATNLLRNGVDLLIVKVLGGWDSFSAMEGYLGFVERDIDRGYHRAMKRARERHMAPSVKTTISLQQALALKRAREADVRQGIAATAHHRHPILPQHAFNDGVLLTTLNLGEEWVTRR